MDNLVKWTLILLALFGANLIAHSESTESPVQRTHIEAHADEAARPF